jgi:hypothetical protein
MPFTQTRFSKRFDCGSNAIGIVLEIVAGDLADVEAHDRPIEPGLAREDRSATSAPDEMGAMAKVQRPGF